VDGNQRYVALDPYEGGKQVVAEAARNVACTGAVPIGITNCLNFGNPDKPAVFHQFREACRGISDACRAFGTPVTGGNVSFYNESPTGAVDPTPVIGMVGLLQDVRRRAGCHFTTPGHLIALAGVPRGHLGGSAYWAEILDFVGGPPPPVDLDAEHRLQHFLVKAIEAGILASAHDLSDGGLAVGVAEACIGGPYADRVYGATVDLQAYGPGLAAEAALFGEDQARAVVSLPFGKRGRLAALAREHRVPLYGAGRVTASGAPLEIRLPDRTLQWEVPSLRALYYQAIPRRMAAIATSGGEGS
jgi:phosphoribosylformylglycinamidine synthase